MIIPVSKRIQLYANSQPLWNKSLAILKSQLSNGIMQERSLLSDTAADKFELPYH
jgi:hypothetical protein